MSSKIGPKEAARRALREFGKRPTKLVSVQEGQDYALIRPEDLVVINKAIRRKKPQQRGKRKPATDPKSIAAILGQRGGLARARNMTAEQRKASAKLAAQARWPNAKNTQE